jgi:hypothetical protein
MEVRVKKDLPIFTRIEKGVVFWAHPIRAGETVGVGRKVRLSNFGNRRKLNLREVKVGEREKHFALETDLRNRCERLRVRRKPLKQRN